MLGAFKGDPKLESFGLQGFQEMLTCPVSRGTKEKQTKTASSAAS